MPSGCNVGIHQKIFAESECHIIEGTHADVQHCSALTLWRELPQCTFPPVPLRSAGTFLWDSTLATPQVLGDHRREDRSQQWKAFRAIPGCRTFGRDLCRPCRLEKSSHLFQDKIQRCYHVSGFLNSILLRTSGKQVIEYVWTRLFTSDWQK